MPTRKVQAPRVTPPSLTALTESASDLVRSGADLDGLSIEDADLTDLRLDSTTWMETVLTGARMRGTQLHGCRFVDVRIDRLDALDLVASGSTWRHTEILSSRLAAGLGIVVE